MSRHHGNPCNLATIISWGMTGNDDPIAEISF